ncbi:metallophosphoesterase family protein [Undibacterium sp. SXout11W]|uniref:metallophosphoesterase family protein n=1 Tax=Undibacterium sp. SXout11W TaxID=3413050 RepID=UPI003BF32A13
MNTSNFLLYVTIPFILFGCSGLHQRSTEDSALESSWILVGEKNQQIVRVNTNADICPNIIIDSQIYSMQLRAAKATIERRPTPNSISDSKASVFSSNTCEITVPPKAKRVMLGTKVLPVLKATLNRILVLGDTGCRMKKNDHVFQNCSDEDAWPFPQLAKTAASFKPDLVLHVGDYHYRETACPDDAKGCKDSPWGYGSDAWSADFLQPAAPLLSASPWIFVRGNHEECARAGQGWFRYLSPEPYTEQRTCDLEKNDAAANYSQPYAVSLGNDTQIIVFDSAKVGQIAIDQTNPQYLQYLDNFMVVNQLANKPTGMSIFTSHHPVFGFVQYGNNAPTGFGAALQSVLEPINSRRYFPEGVQLALHGHVHNFQALNFVDEQPATFIVGNGGDNLDPKFPTPFPMEIQPAPNVTLKNFSHTNQFGFMLMERDNHQWNFKIYTRKGKLLNVCSMLVAGKIQCEKFGDIGDF